jgi:hypothetical protein
MICNERGKNSGDGIDLVAGFALQNIYSRDLSFRGTGWLWGAFLKEECEEKISIPTTRAFVWITLVAWKS